MVGAKKKSANKPVKRTQAAAAAGKAATKRVPAKLADPAPTVEPSPEVATLGASEKLVRDSFTMPTSEYEQIAALKARLIAQAHVIKKSELLRAGIAALVSMSDRSLIAAVEKVQRLKTGRPTTKKAPGGKPKKKS